MIANTAMNIEHHNLQTGYFMIAELGIFQRESGRVNLDVLWEFKR